MKKIFFTMALAAATLALTSCSDDESEGKSRITYYPTIELKGSDFILTEKGKPFSEPGYVSIMGGEDVTDKVIVTGDLDTNKSGLYTLTYTTTKNSDGFGASTTRTVFVADPNDAAEGVFYNLASGTRVYNGNTVAYGRDFRVVVFNNGNGTYTVDDLFGGWYCQRAGYGNKYAMGGVISIGGDGIVSLVQSKIPGWGDSLDDLTGTFDAATCTYSLVAVYNSNTMFFNQTWVKQQ